MSKQTIDAGEGYRLLGPDEKPDKKKGDEVFFQGNWRLTYCLGDVTVKSLNNRCKDLQAYRCKNVAPKHEMLDHITSMAAKLVDEIARRHKKSLRQVERVAIDAVRVAVFKRRHAADVREFRNKCMKGKI